MADHIHALFIVEGEVAEPALIAKIFDTFLPTDATFEFYSYKTNLHTLAEHLESYYPDFDDYVDVLGVLRELEQDDERKAILSGKYTDIFYIFDFEPQNHTLHFDTIAKLFDHLNDSADQGKLFINYPMLESYKHLRQMPDHAFKNRTVSLEDCLSYKQLIDSESAYQDLRALNYQTLTSIIVHHLRKANHILTDRYELPEKNAFLNWNHQTIFDHERALAEQEKCVSVLNTCVFVIVDYQPTKFFKNVQTHKEQFLI